MDREEKQPPQKPLPADLIQTEQENEQQELVEDEYEDGGVLAEDEAAEIIDMDGNEIVEDGEIVEDDEETKQAKELAAEFQKMFDEDNTIQSFDEHEDSVYCVDVAKRKRTTKDEKESKENDFIYYCCSGDGADCAYIWDINSETHEASKTTKLVRPGKSSKKQAKQTTHKDSVNCCAFSIFDQGGMIATAALDGTIFLWETETGKFLRELEGPQGEIEFLCWHPSGPVLLAGSGDNCLWMWNANSGDLMQCFSGHLAPVLCGCFTSDGKLVVSGSEDGSVFVWNPKTGKSLFHWKGIHEGPVICVACSPLFEEISNKQQPQASNKRMLLSGSQDGSICLFSLESGKFLRQWKEAHQDSVEVVSFCPLPVFSHLFASASVDGAIKIWDLTNYQNRATCQHEHAVTSMKWLPSTYVSSSSSAPTSVLSSLPYIISSSLDHRLMVWDARNGACVRQLLGHSDAVLCSALSPDGKFVVGGSDDRSCLVWEWEKAQETKPKEKAETSEKVEVEMLSSSSKDSEKKNTE